MPEEVSLTELFSAAAPRVYSINPGEDFLRSLAVGIRSAIAKHQSLEISDVKIYLPTRRAKRALVRAFVETAPHGRASLLPQIHTLGDIDGDEILLFDGRPIDDFNVAPAISAEERQLTLASLVAAHTESFRGQKNWAASIAAAAELADLLDSLSTNEIPASQINAIVPDTLAKHWRQSQEFLSIVTRHWPNYLAERKLLDPSTRRIQLIDLQNAHWRNSPPDYAVIIAGTTGSTPAVSRLIKTVASLPMGAVVLPGLDQWSEDSIYESIDESHPQFGLKKLITALGIERKNVARWRQGNPSHCSARIQMFSVALRPAIRTDSWLDWANNVGRNKAELTAALQGVELIESSDEDREAAAISLKIRESLENRDATIALVTPNRELSRRVIQKLGRWNISVDDSAGIALANTPCGAFLRLVSNWLTSPLSAVGLLSVVRHPLFGGGLSQAARARMTDALDQLLRGLSANGDHANFADAFRERIEQNSLINDPLKDHALALIDIIEDLAGPFDYSTNEFKIRFEQFIVVAENFASTDQLPGNKILWRGEDGDIAAKTLGRIRENLEIMTSAFPSALPDILFQLISSATVHRRIESHPRVKIYGPLEARLQFADVMILGGLNEGVWPREAAIDPFLSRGMRREMELPTAEERIGLAAHDFAQLTAAPHVVLTRSAKSDGKPTTPSRWIVRLKNILRGADAEKIIDKSARYEFLARRMDEPKSIKIIGQPSPRPPVEARPREFFVTRIEKLLRDPYWIYCREILELKKLDRHDEDFDRRHLGSLFHKIFEEFLDDADAHHGKHELDRLNDLFSLHAATYGMDEKHAPFWRAQAQSAFEQFIQWNQNLGQNFTPRLLEAKGSAGIEIGGNQYVLRAIADRIDTDKSGAAYVIDYKTGDPPSKKQSNSFSPQLPLTGLIVEAGGYESIGKSNVAGLEYIRVLPTAGREQKATIWSDEECAAAIKDAEQGLHNLMPHFCDPQTPYLSQPRPEYMNDYGDYDHLARRRERNAHGDIG